MPARFHFVHERKTGQTASLDLAVGLVGYHITLFVDAAQVDEHWGLIPWRAWIGRAEKIVHVAGDGFSAEVAFDRSRAHCFWLHQPGVEPS